MGQLTIVVEVTLCIGRHVMGCLDTGAGDNLLCAMLNEGLYLSRGDFGMELQTQHAALVNKTLVQADVTAGKPPGMCRYRKGIAMPVKGREMIRNNGGQGVPRQ